MADEQERQRKSWREAQLGSGYADLIARDMRTIGVPGVLHRPSASRIPPELYPYLKRSIAERMSIGLVGHHGVGKTGYLAMVVQEHLRLVYKEHGDRALYVPNFAAHTVMWIDWPRRSDELKQISTSGSWEDPKAYITTHEIRMLETRNVQLVVIDDLGREKPSAYPVDQLFLLVDELFNNRPEIQVLWTTNLPPELDLKGWLTPWAPPGKCISNVYSPAFLSRLGGMAAPILVSTTDDQRLKR